ncbi:hypothetical protein ScalyP_jg4106 [Parmales sp. scaly parma]|nr:hypothetical protein ScalyP_jg4106 [Parmales sp. scaly parma]|tara:strand:+ start:240 stop:1175 length:936 start_codon:yes stop_codon:yes gene_type:complete
MATVTELSINCSDGMVVKGRRYSPFDSASSPSPIRNVLCLHGWLDNCDSYFRLAPFLATAGANAHTVTTIDFIGHGQSSHKSADAPMLLADYSYYVREVVAKLDYFPEGSKFSLVGHSMGSGVACMFTSAFPDLVDKLVMIEGIGPLYKNPKDSPQHLRKHIDKRINYDHKRPQRPVESIDIAVKMRLKTVSLSPGEQYMDEATARKLVERSITTDIGTGKISFRHDPRLHQPSILYNTREATSAYLRAIECPVLFIAAKDGWPVPNSIDEAAITGSVDDGRVVFLPGSHHLHADEKHHGAVNEEIFKFLS